MDNAPTSETDAFKMGCAKAAESGGMGIRHHTNQEWAEFARKLEWERDEERDLTRMLKAVNRLLDEESESYKKDRNAWKACASQLALRLMIHRSYVDLADDIEAIDCYNRLNAGK